MIASIAVLICISIFSFGIVAYEIYYRVTRNIYPFCKKGDKHEK